MLGPNALTENSFPARLGVGKGAGDVAPLTWCLSAGHGAQGSSPVYCAGRPPSILEVEAGGSEVQGHLHPVGSQSGLRETLSQKKIKFEGAFWVLLTSNSSSVLFSGQARAGAGCSRHRSRAE